ncbi:MAG: hypothetical protein HDR30_03475 [Lachnospiraceae bacterium]|nr:hypothetical protein [Lachnospiraceae bacterium]
MREAGCRAKKIIKYGIAVLIAVYLCLCFSMHLSVRDSSFTEGSYMLYYIVNADGMKGLGHSIIMIVDENGCGTVLSYNGMQRTLWESLWGKSGIGKMSIGTMNAGDTEAFLQTGNLHIDGDQLTDNYDYALYRAITAEDYNSILEQTVPYLDAEEQFTALYEKWAMEEDDGKKSEYKQSLEQMGKGDDLTVYQIYKHNCDHAARMLASSIDSELQDYTSNAWRMTPNGNFKAFGRKTQDWGVMTLGKQSPLEKILMFLMIF